MSAFLRESIAFLGRVSGVPWLIRNLWARSKVTILFYHDPAPDVFERHMACVARSYNFISLADLVTALHRRDWSAIPRMAVVVTFDDGHRGNYALLPVFRKHGIRPT